jgi:DNA polymerase-1
MIMFAEEDGDALRSGVLQCKACGLREGCSSPVPFAGDFKSPVFIVGEAPGGNEDKTGVPLTGLAGQELDNYLRMAGLSREACYITNLVKCRPLKNRDPKPEEIRTCSGLWLEKELQEARPKVVAALGRFAATTLLHMGGVELPKSCLTKDGLADMEMVHGLPFKFGSDGAVVVPIYHPAAGLHDSGQMIKIIEDFKVLGQVVRGEQGVRGDLVPVTICEEDIGLDLESVYFDGASCIALDTEVASDGEVLCFSMSKRVGKGLVVNAKRLNTFGGSVNEDMRRHLAKGGKIILHNALYDIPQLKKLGLDLTPWLDSGLVIDTMVIAYLLQNQPQGLKALAYRLCEMEMREFKEVVESVRTEADVEIVPPKTKKGKGKRIEKPLDARDLMERNRGLFVRYAARDADATLRVYHELEPLIRAEGLEKALALDMGSMAMVLDMREVGFPIDSVAMMKYVAEVETRMELLKGEFFILNGFQPINLDSPKQLKEFLYGKLGLPNNYAGSTAEKAIKPLTEKHEAVGKLLEYRKLQKMRSTVIAFVENAEEQPDGRMRPQYMVTRTPTGRMASKDPNILSTPKKSAEAKELRKGFVAADGCVLLELDYSQIELRLMAHESGDENFRLAYILGEDIHQRTADKMGCVRSVGKTINFGIGYGMSESGLYDQCQKNGVDIPGATKAAKLRTCRGWIEAWFDAQPSMREYFSKKEAEVRMTGMVKNIFGRFRRIPQVYSTVGKTRAEGVRYAANAPIQSGAVDIMKAAMIGTRKIYKEESERMGMIFNPLLQFHDALIFEVSEWAVEFVARVLKSAMEQVVCLDVPVVVEAEAGKNWGEMKKLNL